MPRKAFKYRLYPTQKQEHTLCWTLDRCRELYNAALTERRDAYTFHVRQHPNYYDEQTRKHLTKELTVTYHEQKGNLPLIKAELREEYQDIHSQVLQDVLLRLERAFQNFFRRVREHAQELDRDTNAAINILTAWKRPTLWSRLCGKRDQDVEAPCL